MFLGCSLKFCFNIIFYFLKKLLVCYQKKAPFFKYFNIQACDPTQDKPGGLVKLYLFYFPKTFYKLTQIIFCFWSWLLNPLIFMFQI